MVARLEARDEALFHRAQRAAAEPLHLDGRVADDGAHLQAVALRDAAVRHAVAALHRHHAVVLRVGLQAGAALRDELQRPVELLARQLEG